MSNALGRKLGYFTGTWLCCSFLWSILLTAYPPVVKAPDQVWRGFRGSESERFTMLKKKKMEEKEKNGWSFSHILSPQ